jgi:hypothetical protein
MRMGLNAVHRQGDSNRKHKHKHKPEHKKNDSAT